jgi:hypothetical protein
LWLIIGGASGLLILIGVCCYIKNKKKDPYFDRGYSTVDGENETPTPDQKDDIEDLDHE